MKLVRAAGFSPPARAGSWDSREAVQALSFQETALLKAVLAAGLYDSVGRVICAKPVDVTERPACVVETAQGKAQVHPSSVNRALQTHGWLLYQEKVKRRPSPTPTPTPSARVGFWRPPQAARGRGGVSGCGMELLISVPTRTGGARSLRGNCPHSTEVKGPAVTVTTHCARSRRRSDDSRSMSLPRGLTEARLSRKGLTAASPKKGVGGTPVSRGDGVSHRRPQR